MKFRKLIASVVMLILLLYINPCSLSVLADGAEVSDSEDSEIYNTDFEGETDGWTPFGAGTLSADNNIFHSGNTSLHIKDRMAMWNGPSLECINFITLDHEAHFSAWAYQESGTAEQISMTLKLTNSNGNTDYENLFSADTVSGEWAQMQGAAYIGPDIVSAILYIESPNENLEYNIDDILISVRPVSTVVTGIQSSENKNDETTPGKQHPKYDFSFEYSFDNWTARGDDAERISRTDEYSSSGKYSLYITDRKETWHGATVDIDDIPREVDYNYSAYVMYNGINFGDSHTFLLQLQYELDGNTVYEIVSEKEIRKNSWSKISGVYSLPKDAKKVSFYIQTANVDGAPTADDLMPFYIDQILIEDSTAAVKNKYFRTLITVISCIGGLIIVVTVVALIIKKSKKARAALLFASTDAMTHTFNRNSYEEQLEKLEKNPDSLLNLYFILCDVNFLKYINDNYGHEKGDDAIIRCGRLLMNTVGKKGKVYRIGGDEFMCICDVSLEKEVSDAIEIESKKYEGYPFEIAVGSSSYDKESDGEMPVLKEIIKRCDTKMYENKQKIKKENKDFSRQ